MKFINITDIEELILAKVDIEKFLMKEKTIDKKYTIPEFVVYATSNNIVYVNNRKFISFSYVKTNNEQYVFVQDNYSKEIINTIKDFFVKYAQNSNFIKEIKPEDLLEKSYDEYYVIKNKYYILQ